MLENIKSPEDIKSFTIEELTSLATDIRQEIIHVVSKNGGHLASNLGVVELSLALHYVFSTPKDNFIFDVSHQGYVHKLLTGRKEDFHTLRQTNGLSGFLSRKESPHDAFGAGHAGTALSAALGMAVGRDLRLSDEHVVAVIGDASLTCGISMEAMNNIAHQTKRLIIVLNDNKWAIAKNVGAIATYLNELIKNPTYNTLHSKLEHWLKKIPLGETLIRWGSVLKSEAKDLFVPASLFEKYGLRYVGPIDGHNMATLIEYLEFCKKSDTPILLHIHTIKGKGLPDAHKNPEKFHGLNPQSATPNEAKNYQDVFGSTLSALARKNPKIIAITAAMRSGTGLSSFATEFPTQFFDVGIAEEHAVIFAAAMATKGLKPVCAIYSTFLQRSFDQIHHDICLQDLPVVFCLDRAGLTPGDGPTHHGLFDIAYTRCIPNSIVMQPKDEDELADMLYTAIDVPHPTFIRYPRGNGQGVLVKADPVSLPIGKAEILREGTDLIIWALGPLCYEALEVAEAISQKLDISVGVVNARFVKPLDTNLLYRQAAQAKMIVTWEDHVLSGGFGSAILEALQSAKLQIPVESIAWPDEFIKHGTTSHDIRTAYSLTPEAVSKRIVAAFSR